MHPRWFIGFFIWGFISVACFITFSILLGVANTDDYIRNCTVIANAPDTKCYLVSPRDGNITFPYEPQYKEYTGNSMPCRYINQTLTCYTYDEDHRASEDEKPDIVTRVTTSYSKAFSNHNLTYIILLIIFGISTLLVLGLATYLAAPKCRCREAEGLWSRGGYDQI